MKKIMSMLFLLICIFILTACNNSEKLTSSNNTEILTSSNIIDSGEIDNQKEVDEFKALLNKQDISPFYERMFTSVFKQDYVSYTNSYKDEEERNIDFYRYLGTGAYGYFYNVTQDEYKEIMAKENVNPFDFITEGFGNYSLIQSAHINAFSSELVDGIEKRTTRDFNFSQRLDSQFDDTDFQLYNSLEINDKSSDNPSETTNFNGKVNKESLLEVASTSWLTDTIQRICGFDGQKNTEFIDDLYYEVCRNLMNKTDKEFSDFIKNNKIVISDGEEYTELSFEINDEEIIQILIDNDIFPGLFKGTLYYDKESGSFERYLYEINYITNNYINEDDCISSTTLKFEATGTSYHHTYEKIPYITPNPVVYTDAYEFVNDMVQNITPPDILL